MKPTKTNRRSFLRQTAGTALGVAAASAFTPKARAGGSKKYVIAMVGTGGRGGFLMDFILKRGDVEVAYVSDPDSTRMNAAADAAEKIQGTRPKAVGDFRKVLDDKNVMAIFSATPDHWHALTTVLACQAGKDVYVEKPASYCVWEGRQMVEAARKYKRVVQLGTQTRSGGYVKQAVDYVQSGKLGKVCMIRILNMKQLDDIGRKPDTDAPEGVDYDTWLGPAPKRRFNLNRFHGTWHYRWDYSGGDIINDGVHQIDVARWLSGKDSPMSVASTGGMHFFTDDHECPDTQTVTWDFDGLTMVLELAMWTPYMKKMPWELRDGDTYPDWTWDGMKVEVLGSKGFMFMERHGGGWQAFDQDDKKIAEVNDHHPHIAHVENFFQCLETRAKPNADIEIGHLSTVLCQIGNISYRCDGRKLKWDGKTETFPDDKEANKYLKRPVYREPWVFPQITA